MTSRHCYLFTLEVSPMKEGDVYNELPQHCTLMHRFWSELASDELVTKVDDFFIQVAPVKLKPYEQLLLGPKQIPVSELELTDKLFEVHQGLYRILNELGVEYTVPEWVGSGYRAHVSERDGVRLELGSEHISQAIYLIEVKVPGHDHQRFVRHKFSLTLFTGLPSVVNPRDL